MTVIARALVIGGGIGGLVAARALRQQGIAVDLIEREPRWTVYGVGIIQPNNALRALDRIGLAQQCLDHGGPFDGWRIHDAQGNVLIDPPGDNSAAPHLPPNNGITRPKLHEILIQGAKEVGTDIRLGTIATALHDDGDGVDATFSDGEVRRYDLVLGYDGLFSETRRMLFGDTYKPRFNGQGVWRYNFERPADMDTGKVFFGPDTKIGLVPMSPALMYMFVVTAEADSRWYDGPTAAEEMRSRLKGYGGPIERLSQLITDPAGVVYRPMLTLLVDDPWHKGRILIAGDAAHSTTPHLAQGAAMAIEDAVLLGELLGGDGSLDAAMSAFMRRRFDRVKYVVDTCDQLAAWELEEWRGIDNPDADQGGLLHRATHALMADY
ncbi:NAD(P)-binding protein [Sphingomonas histidinilytica]|uniref:2-polyprenyl-6-methoxyphenol hydroxylase n=1 Tax=Rhizorhabdus histidinilytica TaxID=439228 RepID=A0A1T4ZTD4_9SPHN|nr:FAD-dependent monooxygenase [Rhizorhabdus histidinilytica]MBO9377606.1 NAD(P)-binding protein [Rhizorhabdus histidinilytica]SKB26000.1 2-polyprenyl-6-methoxyphenol hydroxylase [Rhizorhabdus histidinilytica]